MQSISPRRESDHEHPHKSRQASRHGSTRQGGEGFPPLRSQEPRHRRRFRAGRAVDVAPGVCGLSDRRRQDAARHRGRSARLRRHRVRWNRDDRSTSFRDGNGRPHQPAPDRCRGDGGRLVACEGAAGTWRRGQIRQPGYRRVAQHPALSDPDARDRRIGAGHARSRRRQALERAGVRGQGRESRGGSCRKRPPSRLRRPRRRCGQGIGAQRRRPEAEGPEGLSLSRQGRDQHCRSSRHHGRHRALRHRHPPSRHEIRRDRAAAGDRRQARVVRFQPMR